MQEQGAKTRKKRIRKNQIMNTAPEVQAKPEDTTLKHFGCMLIIIEIILIVILWIFVKDSIIALADPLQSQRYPAFQDINAMVLIGFGFMMTFIRSYAWSSLTYTFFLNAFITELYIIFEAYWSKVLAKELGVTQVVVSIDITTLIKCSYAVFSAMISVGCIIGRCGPKDLLIIMSFHVFGYSLNRVSMETIGMVDAGGSATVHVYGAYFGLTVCLAMARRARPRANIKVSYFSNITAFIGTMFMWIYWPSFNYASVAQNQFQQSLIVVNTVLALCGSVIGTYIVSSLGFGRGLKMENILNATLAGGVAIGAPCVFIYRPGVALLIGCSTGVISVLCFHFLTPLLYKTIKLYDTCGIHSLYGIPGILGGLWSAVIIAVYNSGYDSEIGSQYSNGHFLFSTSNSFLKQGGIQVAGTFLSLAYAVFFGLAGGLVASRFYNERPWHFYKDSRYFQNAHYAQFYGELPGQNCYLDQRPETGLTQKEKKYLAPLEQIQQSQEEINIDFGVHSIVKVNMEQMFS